MSLHLEVHDESYRHNVPAGSESHFKVVIVSDLFTGQRFLQRHRAIYGELATELAGSVHALALHTHAQRVGWAAGYRTRLTELSRCRYAGLSFPLQLPPKRPAGRFSYLNDAQTRSAAQKQQNR